MGLHSWGVGVRVRGGGRSGPPLPPSVRDSLARALGWPRDAAAFAPVSSVTLPWTDRERFRSHVARPSPLPSSNTRANVPPASLHPPGNTTTHRLRPQRLSRRTSVHVLCRYGLNYFEACPTLIPVMGIACQLTDEQLEHFAGRRDAACQEADVGASSKAAIRRAARLERRRRQ